MQDWHAWTAECLDDAAATCARLYTVASQTAGGKLNMEIIKTALETEGKKGCTSSHEVAHTIKEKFETSGVMVGAGGEAIIKALLTGRYSFFIVTIQPL